jgi:hypothetical protein
MLSDHNVIKLEFNNKRNSRKFSNTWTLNNTLLHDQQVIEEMREEIKRFLEFNKNESKTYQNLWDLRGKFIVINAYIKNTEGSQINDCISNS